MPVFMPKRPKTAQNELCSMPYCETRIKLGDETVKILAVSLKEERTKARLTQAQLAELLEVDDQHVYKLEAGLRNITASLIAKCVDLFGSARFARIGATGERRYVVLSEDALKPGPARPRSSRYASLSQTEKIVVLGKELGDAQAEVENLPRCLLNPDARRENLRRLLKESIDVDQVLDALMESVPPELVREVAAASECAPDPAPMGVSA